MNNDEILQNNVDEREDKLVRLYLRRYVNGFRASDIKALEIDCILEEVRYSDVYEKIVDTAYYSY